MTKCDFCVDQLEQGNPPACVAACPLRVLDYGEAENHKGIPLWDTPSTKHPFPLPTFSHTQPRLAIQPHPAMSRTEEKVVANIEEVQPRKHSPWEDVPLMIFTLLGQMAVGGFWAMLWMFPSLWASVQFDRIIFRIIPSLFIGASLGLGMLASFAHLGTKKNAWRMLGHLKKSWLSREILFALLFGLGWLSITGEMFYIGKISPELAGITASIGLGLVYSMAQVYRLGTMPGWNTSRTNIGFMVSTFLLGSSGMSTLLTVELKITGIQVPSVQWIFSNGVILILLLVQLILMQDKHSTISKLRIGLLVLGMAWTVLGILYPTSMSWLGLLIFVFVLVEEVLGRWLFYQVRK